MVAGNEDDEDAEGMRMTRMLRRCCGGVVFAGQSESWSRLAGQEMSREGKRRRLGHSRVGGGRERDVNCNGFLFKGFGSGLGLGRVRKQIFVKVNSGFKRF